MDILPTSNALDNPLHRRAYRGDWHKYGPLGKPALPERKALEIGQIMTSEIWDSTAKKAKDLLKYDDKIEQLVPIAWEARLDLLKRKAGEGDPLPAGVTIEMLESRVKLLDTMVGEMRKRREDFMKHIVYTEKEQVNKIYSLLQSERMADKLFRQQILVATTRFLVADVYQITQALSDLVHLLFHDVLQNRREKD